MPVLVTVIVPAWNAAATIDETLRSIRLQTHRELEILVIDDGSDDETPAIVARHAEMDERIVLISQPNAGVAAARNRGLAQARGEYVALIDADDLWRPEKIARQLAALAEEGEGTGASYTHFRRIDAQGFDVAPPQRPLPSGEIAGDLRFGNFIGHCSSILFRRDLVERIGGFDPGLRAAGAQGCEDIDFFMRLAAVTRIVCVPELLTGYRELETSMSANGTEMLRSWKLVEKAARRREPAAAADLAQGRGTITGWLILRALRQRRWTAIGALVHGHGAGRLCLPRAIWRAWRQRESSQQRGAFGQREDLPRPFRAGHIPGEIKA